MIVGNKLLNPLDAYSTYSTHFVILAGRSSEHVRDFTDTPGNSDTLDRINQVQALGEQVPGTAGDVFLVMDTRRFSQYTVESMKYDVFINGLSKGNSPANLATAIEMRILDSVGISFVNYLQWIMDTKLQTNFDGLIFVIRVMFVGVKANGEAETIQSVSIPASLFKLELNLDYAKGVYDVEFMPAMNFAVGTHSRWLNIGKVTSFFSGNGKATLGDMVGSFEASLNAASSKFYNSLLPELMKGGGGTVQTNGKFGREVQYQITLPGQSGKGDVNWANFAFTGKAVAGSVERDFVAELKKLENAKTPEQQKSSAAADKKDIPTKDVHFAAMPNVLITDVLDLMFKQVAEIQEMANAEAVSRPDGKATFYKYVIGISSNDDRIIVHVDVVAFEVPNLPPPSAKTTTVSQYQDKFYADPDENGVRKPKNYIEMDYIFTGRNTDIINFDMKIQDLQFMLAANVKVSEGESFAQALLGQNPPNQKQQPNPREKEVLRMRRYDPVLIPMLTEQELKSFSNFVTARSKETNEKLSRAGQEYTRNLSAFYASSPIQIGMTMRGNPDVMLKFCMGALPPHISFYTNNGSTISNANEGERAKYREQFEDTILKVGGSSLTKKGSAFILNKQLGDDSYASTPCFVKVNIKGPNVDFKTNGKLDGEFATDVLYDNYYVVFKVTNLIENGVFTQQLELWSHNVFGGGMKIAKEVLSAARTL